VIDCVSVHLLTTRVFLGDRLPALELDVSENGHRFDFTGWTLTLEISGPITATGAATGNARGEVTFAWAAGATATPGYYAVIIHGTSPTPESLPRTFRADQPLRIEPA